MFQRRTDGTVDFYRDWENYRLGFGEPHAEHWLGNHNINILTSIYERNELRIDMESVDKDKAYAQYTIFHVASESQNYTLTVGGYVVSSTAGDINN